MKKDAKKGSTGSIRKPAHRKGAHSLYSNLATKRRTKTDAKSRKKAEYLATLPKSRLKRMAYRLNPKRFFKYWFSKEGGIMALKIAGLGLAAFIVLILGVFALFRKDLALGPDELTKRVQSRTTKFYDRTGQVLLYELYKDQQLTFVKPEQINDNMKWATVAIEDKDFYQHSGFDIRGIMRSVFVNVSGTGRQGASTITQQLARNVILEDNTRTGIAGYTRKLKEIILSIELERSYSKDEILNFYLNSIGYGGTAYGVESAAQRYFGKSAKDLSIEESAYIASIPQYPSLYDRNSPSFDAETTLARQRTVIDYMLQQGYITSEQAKEAKQVDILATIKPLSSDPTTKLAPHLIDEAVKELEGKYGADNVRKGGWRVITTVDWEMQQLAEKAVAENMRFTEQYGGNNAALVAIEAKTGQVLSMVGSRDYGYPGYGSYNAATSDLQPGSSLKPFVYATVFEGNQYGPGSVIPDTRQCWYNICPKNFEGGFYGNVSIRTSLANSRNLPAMKAADIAGMGNVIDRLKKAGQTHITCGQAGECSDPFLAIGSGTVRLDEHVASYAALANNGMAKPKTMVLKIEKPNGEVVEEWQDSEGTPVFSTPERSSEISFLTADIMSDARARSRAFGGRPTGFSPAGVKVAVKTGTTDNNKDAWMMGFSPKLAVGVWTGRADGAAMSRNSVTHIQTGPIFGNFMEQASKQVMSKPQYGYTPNEWYKQPNGIQRLTVSGQSDLFQSWYRKPKEELRDYVMDRVSKKLATDCTPEAAKETIKVTVVSDPRRRNSEVTGTPPEGYDIQAQDDVHQCGDPLPSASISTTGNSGRTYTLTATVTAGRAGIQTVEFIVNGQVVSSQAGAGATYSTQYSFPAAGSYTVQVRVTDTLYYQNTNQQVTLVP